MSQQLLGLPFIRRNFSLTGTILIAGKSLGIKLRGLPLNDQIETKVAFQGEIY